MKLKALLLLEPGIRPLVYGAPERARIDGLLTLVAPPQSAATYARLGETLRDVEVIITSWGMPRIDEDFLQQFPRLKIVFYAAGSVRGFVTPASWKHGVRVVSATSANAIPAAEFAFAQIILCLKQTWPLARATRQKRGYARAVERIAGTYGSTVGLLALGRIGQRVAQRLQTLSVRVLAYDPVIEPAAAAALNVSLGSLEEVFANADVVSCHLPLLPETRQLVRATHFRAMKEGASFINTARGEVVAQDEMISVLQARPDLFAALDVTHPEPPAPDSPLYAMPNVILTPHIAGCAGRECARLGAAIVDDIERWLRGEFLDHEVTESTAANLA
ncbi:MAG: glycerate dehydrogenase [Verrucomicrobia bacterium]|nr:glycerate dehydrogenase [Verrucomicrobiota bacterium]